MTSGRCGAAIAWWALVALAAALPAREWTVPATRQHVEAELVDVGDGRVLLKPTDGPVFGIRLEDLAEDDRRYLRAELDRRRAELEGWLSDKPSAVRYGPGRELAQLESKAIKESSGLACSRRRPGVFWTHNDSGDEARLYALDLKGRDLGSCLIEGVTAFDFEDIASVQLDGRCLLLVGDIGNNVQASAVQVIHVVEEPAFDPARGPLAVKVPVVQTIHLAYEDDQHDAEALGVDPTTRTILLIAKERKPKCHVYAFGWPADDAKKVTIARKIATLHLPSVTAMDLSPDGLRAVVCTYGHAYEFSRAKDEDWSAGFSRKPCEIKLPPRRQGEAICYGPDGKTLYLTSEKRPTPLIEVPVKE